MGINFDKIKNIYMIGIKGVGMTMLAQYLHSQGLNIEGSDTGEVFMTDKVLKKLAIKVHEGFREDNIPTAIDLIIFSRAYNSETNPEVAVALNGNVKTLSYAEALGEVFNLKYGIAVTGSHGKTTTTAWLGYVLDRAGFNPGVMVGAYVPQFEGTSIIGTSDYLVVETDEYQNKLKYYNPKIVILNNIDYDHPDFFPTEEAYAAVFVDFIKRIPKKGMLVVNYDDPKLKSVASVNCRAKVISYAINEAADYVAYDIRQDKGQQFFKVHLSPDPTPGTGEGSYDEVEELGNFSIRLNGQHNISNALAVIATAIELNVDLVDIRKYLEEFKGTARRMEIMGKFRGATIIDDYAHHPAEIKATLEAIRKTYEDKKLLVVFHPHTFTRTKVFLDDFAASFDDADAVIVLDIYGSAREKQGGVHSKDLVKKIKETRDFTSDFVKYIPTLKEAEEYLRKNAGNGDVVVLMGAGDVFRVGEELLK
ncbi:UDP-N-acetylmuramate--L-alanine ligase [bacterium]|nr:UDP-N-acetylmuramate--L-alanine ligase [bacterium]